MKKVTLFLAILMATCWVQAQQPDFYFEHPMPEYEYSYNAYSTNAILEINNGCCLIALSSVEAETWFLVNYPYENLPAKVFKVSPMGEFVGELSLGLEGAPFLIDGLFHAPDDPSSTIALGRNRNLEQEYDQFFIARFDQDLNLQWQRDVELPDDYKMLLYGARSFMDSTGDIVVCVVPFEAEPNGGFPPVDCYHRLYVRLSAEGELEALESYPVICDIMFGAQGEMFEFQDGTGDYGHVVEEYESKDGNRIPYLIRTDRNFTSFTRVSLPKVISFPLENNTIAYYGAAARAFADNTVVIAAEDSYGWWDTITYDGGFGNAIAIMKYDIDGNLQAMSHTVVEGDLNYDENSQRNLAWKKGMDVGNDCLYFCYGVYDRVYGASGLTAPNGIALVKTDMDANIIWQRYYCDERHFFLSRTMHATSDGNCLVAGESFDSGYTNPTVFAVKFFSDGTLAIPEMEEFVRPYTYYPNPTQDKLHLQYSPDMKPMQIELYDIQGRLVRSQRNGLESINLEGLPAGTYTMRVTLEDGKMFSDKVIKE